ncbi:MAG: hypothetical protein EOP56_08530 [Sphingobacteriales bacterium]|nr:MAG: hypothetical protein EOP56_08530 [Sphingobacteriales bacterium]
MKYQYFLIAIFYSYSLSAQAQTKDITITDTVAGYYADQKPIPAKQYSFSEKIVAHNIDTVDGYAIVITEQTKTRKRWIYYVDLRDASVRWSKKSGAQSYIITEEVIVEQFSNNTSRGLSNDDGTMRWERKPSLIHADVKNHIGITNAGVGYDLHTGNEVWSRNLEIERGWTEHFMANDTTMMIVTPQTLHKLDIRTSRGWKYDQNPNFNMNADKQAAVNGAFMVGGLVGGVIAYAAVGGFQSAGPGKPVSQRIYMPTNLLIDKDKGYIVTDRKIACMEGENIKWEIDAPEGINAKSTLISIGDELWVTRAGGADAPQKKNKNSELPDIPLILMLGKETGSVKSKFKYDLKASFKDISERNDTAFVLLNNKLLQIHTGNHKLLQEISIDDKLITDAHATIFETDRQYLSLKKSYSSVNELYPGNTFISGPGDYILRFDDQFRFQDSLHKTSFYTLHKDINGYLLMHALSDNRGTTLVKNGKYYGHLATSQLFFVDRKLVYMTEKGINIIDALNE